MKNTLIFLLFALPFILTSCEKADFSSLENSSTSKSNLTVHTRSVDGNSLQYPLAVYAFNASGRCTAKQTLTDAGSTFSLSLPSGPHSLVALGGLGACQLPSNVRLSSFLTLLQESEQPLQIGQANVTVDGTSSKAYLQMRYLVADVRVSLSGLPEEVTNVSMTISKPYSQWSFSGVGGEAKNYTTELHYGSLPGMWDSGPVYVLPTEGTATITLALTSPSGTVSYAYTCPEALKSGVPYVLSGSYSTQGLQVEGEFSVEGWGTPVQWDFNFGPGTSSQGGSIQPQSAPVAGQLWNNHIVVSVEDLNEMEWGITLLSREEAINMPSALNIDGGAEQAAQYEASYAEDELTDWHIPTRDEALMLQQMLGGEKLFLLNELLTQEGLSPFLDYEGGGSTTKARYLCDAGKKTFSMAGTTAPSRAGEKKKYRLRLLKEIIVTK